MDRLMTSFAGRYSVERELGKGGMGTVYLAWDNKQRRQVAIKMLHPELSAAIDRERFLREIEILAGLNHPHILPLHDSDEIDDVLFYVMPYVEGESLREKLARVKQLPLPEAIRIAREVADGLAYAHANGVVHRDIKPGNIMMSAGHAVVADFGVAHVLRALPSDRLTASGYSLGTPVYMSPEQSFARNEVDARTDIYALGCVLYEMVVGDVPFPGATPQVILARKMVDTPPQMRLLRESITESLERATHKALAKNPADRFQTAAEFEHALEAVALDQQLIVTPGPGSPSARAVEMQQDVSEVADTQQRPLWSRVIGWTVGILVMLTVIGFTTVTVYDLKMQIPDELRRAAILPVVGMRALFPGLFSAALWLAGFLLVELAARMIFAGVRRVSTAASAFGSLQQRWSDSANRWSRVLDTAVVAEAYVIGGLAISLFILIVYFRPLLNELWNPGSEILSCSYRFVHYRYTWVLSALIVGLFIVWRRLLRFLRARGAAQRSVTLAQWGGITLMLVLVLIMTAPWKLLWDNERPRVLIGNDKGYILVERGQNIAMYNRAKRTTELYKGDPAGLVRLPTRGYVFEPETGCPGPNQPQPGSIWEAK